MKKGIQFHYFFEQSFFLRKSGCSLKKKKRSSLRFYIRFPYFSLQIRVSSKKKDLHFDLYPISLFFSISHPKSGCLKKVLNEIIFWREVAANNLHTAIIVRKAVSTTTFAYFCGAQFGNRWFREHLDFWAKIAE